MSHYDQKLIRCPFYIADRNCETIRCEGIVEGSHILFDTRNHFRFHHQMQNYCCKDYKRCRIWRMLAQKYEEAD